MKGKNVNDKLYKILLKKAQGFYYKEETDEYSYETVKPVKHKTSTIDNKAVDAKQQISFLDEVETVDLAFPGKSPNENITDNNKEDNFNEDLKPPTLVKKKVTTHFVPPDLLAVKMLLEIDKEIDGGLEDKSTEELKLMAQQLQKSLKL